MKLADLVKSLRQRDEFFTTLEWIRLFVSHVDKAQKGDVIRIVGGELCCKIYDDSWILDAFINANKRGAKIKIIAGPMLSVWGKTVSEEGEIKNRIIELVKEEMVELYYRNSRAEIHYRIVGNGKSKVIHVEVPHNPLAPASERGRLEIPDKNKEEFYQLAKEEFDSFIANKQATLSSDPEKDFLVLSTD